MIGNWIQPYIFSAPLLYNEEDDMTEYPRYDIYIYEVIANTDEYVLIQTVENEKVNKKTFLTMEEYHKAKILNKKEISAFKRKKAIEKKRKEKSLQKIAEKYKQAFLELKED